jgi:hypothetical protein
MWGNPTLSSASDQCGAVRFAPGPGSPYLATRSPGKWSTGPFSDSGSPPCESRTLPGSYSKPPMHPASEAFLWGETPHFENYRVMSGV